MFIDLIQLRMYRTGESEPTSETEVVASLRMRNLELTDELVTALWLVNRNLDQTIEARELLFKTQKTAMKQDEELKKMMANNNDLSKEVLDLETKLGTERNKVLVLQNEALTHEQESLDKQIEMVKREWAS